MRLTKMFSSLVCYRSVPGLEESAVLGSSRLVASTIMLSALLSGGAMHQVHAQNNAPIFNWQGEVQVSTSTLTIREGEALTYNIRLSEQPADDGWWVLIHVDGVVYIDGHLEEKGIRWVPSVGWEFNRKGSSGPTQWRSVRIEALQDDGDDDEFVTITHEVWDENTNCPPSLHGVAPVEVQVTDDETASTGQPRITGTARVGQTLTAVTADIQDADGLGDFAYQWKADGTNIAEAMDSSYTLTNNEVGKRITVTVSFTDGIGTEETVTSQPTAAVRDAASAASPGGGGGLPPPSNPMPSAPRNLVAIGGDEQVTLTWDAPEEDDDDAITDYEYRIDGKGRWISTGSTDTTHTVTGLVNGQVYVFQVRAVNSNRKGRASNRVEATPRMPVALDFAHFANGAGTTSDLVFVNVATHPIRPVLYFYDQEGHPMDPASVVDLTEDLEVTEDGGLSIRTAMEPLGELTVSTHGRGKLVSGSVAVAAKGPIGGVLRFDLPDIGVAGVGASPPVRDALFPARRQAGGIRTAAALHNLGEEAITVSCRLMSGGRVLEAVEIDLEANGQEARYIEELFTATDTSDFVGSVRCTAPGLFTGIAVELDAGNRIFTTLPVVPVARAGGGGQETVLYFAHFANGGGTTSDLVFVNVSPRPSGPGPTPYHTAVSPSRPALYFYDQEGNLMDPASVVDLTGDLEITGDGALSIQTEMEPLGELTISTHGRGALVSGSVKVVSEGPIGGVLRYALPGIGVTGVGASPPVRDALFPVRQEGGLDTAAAIRNLTESDLVVTCRLMKDGAVLEETQIPLAANGQEARYIEEMFTFTGADRSDFVGSVRCTVPPGEAMFTGVAVELDAGNRIFTTLPVVPVPERMSQE